MAITLRGRGLSDAPMAGYSLRDHVSDIAAARATFDREQSALWPFPEASLTGLHPIRDTGPTAEVPPSV